MPTLNLTAFRKAIASLEEALAAYSGNPGNIFVRDACIKRFEYTYDQSHKMLRRYLKMTEGSPEEAEKMTFPELIRTGFDRGLLLHSWDAWKLYRESRNITSHTYDEEKALLVLKVIPPFLEEAKHLLSQLKPTE